MIKFLEKSKVAFLLYTVQALLITFVKMWKATAAGFCELPSQVVYTFLYQEKNGLHRLEGVQIREVTRLFQLAEPYRLTVNVDFIKRLSRTETSWQNPLENYLKELKYSAIYTPDPIFLLIIIVSALLPIVIYLYIDRDVHLRTLKLVKWLFFLLFKVFYFW